MGSPRVKGNALRLTVGGIDYWADATGVRMDNEAGGGLVYDDMGCRWFFDVTAVQSTGPASLWTYLFDHPYAQANFVYAPHGNAVATLEQPHFTGRLQLGAPPALGGAAGAKVTQTFTTRLNILTGPTKVTGTPTP